MFLATGAAAAAPPEAIVTDADIERARQEQPTITEADIERARSKHQTPVETQAASISSPILDALPQPVTKTPIDLDALARGFPVDAQGIQAFDNGPALFVFVSLAMPRPTLERLVEQAARARARLVIRGFTNGSLKETVAQIQPLIGTRKVAIQIDPRAFDRYGVDKVPSFVLERTGTPQRACTADACGVPEAYVLVAGDVSLVYALESMRRMVPAFGMEATHFIKRLKP
jgi:conjugal transfer pilus assembly protein TrbC